MENQPFLIGYSGSLMKPKVILVYALTYEDACNKVALIYEGYKLIFENLTIE